MKDKVELVVGAFLAGIVTYKGFDALLSEATRVVGFITALFGLGTGILIFIWWYRKVKKQ